ncbi:MAG: hypothetical protein WCH79_04765 [Planctomycetia bacterium]
MTRSTPPMPITRFKPLVRGVLALAVAAGVIGAIVRPLVGRAADPPAAATTEPDNAQDDAQEALAAKAEILQSPRWRRAIFELGEWLSVQKIYPPREVQRIKAEFNTKVMKMSPQEIEYLLDDLEAKFKVIETPEAQEARAWMGQYLSAMSDRKRADVLKDVPNVVDMTAAQLSQEIFKIEQTRQTLKDRQVAFDAGKQVLADVAAANRKATADASLAATAQMNSSPSYSPYRSGGSGGSGGSPPFANARTGSGLSIGVGTFGAYVGMSLGNF